MCINNRGKSDKCPIFEITDCVRVPEGTKSGVHYFQILVTNKAIDLFTLHPSLMYTFKHVVLISLLYIPMFLVCIFGFLLSF